MAKDFKERSESKIEGITMLSGLFNIFKEMWEKDRPFNNAVGNAAIKTFCTVTFAPIALGIFVLTGGGYFITMSHEHKAKLY